MRKITEQSVNAFLIGHNFKRSNMEVSADPIESRLYLHGNLIASISGSTLKIFDGGWTSNTTKERLNGLLQIAGVNAWINQKDWVWYLTYWGETEEWEGSAEFILE